MGLTGIDIDANLQGATGTKWRRQKFEYSNGKLIYKACHEKYDAPTSDPNWYIWKYLWSGDNLIDIGLLKGPYDDRTILF